MVSTLRDPDAGGMAMRKTVWMLLVAIVGCGSGSDPGVNPSANGPKIETAEAPTGDAERTPKPIQSATAESAPPGTKVKKNTIGMELVLIKPGSFQMGVRRFEKGWTVEDEPQVDVTLTHPYYLGKTEVTQKEWQAVMGTTPWKGAGDVQEGDSYPATYVSWDDAQAFCRKLSEKEHAEYRLPTDAEWEYACRGGTTTRFSFGDDESQLADHEWSRENSFDLGENHAQEVGRKKPNPFGLYDMHGNVLEWCEDVYVQTLPGGSDPVVTSGDSQRVVRGGAFPFDVSLCRSAARGSFSQSDERSSYLGFRVALTASP